MAGRDPESLDIAAEWPAELVRVAGDVSRARESAVRASTDAATKTARAARRLERMGLSRRDAAEILGISDQRVQQLLAS